MSGERPLMYFAYTSETKVNQLYAQIGDFQRDSVEVEQTISKKREGNIGLSNILSFIQAGIMAGREQQHKVVIKGDISLIQKLRLVIEHIHQHETVGDLRDILARDDLSSLDAFCYTLVGDFNVPQEERWQMEVIDKPSYGWSKLSSPIVTLCTRIKRYRIKLSCSLRFFGDVGGHADVEKDRWIVVPHSGNWPFFNGDISARLEGLIFLGGMKDKTLFGSPLYLTHQFSPDERMPNGFPLHF